MSTPCRRGGCTGDATKAYCSRRCVAVARLCAGWEPHRVLTPAHRKLAGERGGVISGQRERGKALRLWLDRAGVLLPKELTDALGAQDVARIKALLARAAKNGWKGGYRAGHHHRAYQKRTAA